MSEIPAMIGRGVCVLALVFLTMTGASVPLLVIAFMVLLPWCVFSLAQSFRRFAVRCSMAGLLPAPGFWLRQLNESEQNKFVLVVMGTVGIPASVMFGWGVVWILGGLLQFVGVI